MRAESPDIRIIMLTACTCNMYHTQAEAVCVEGYIEIGEGLVVLPEAIREVFRGGIYLCPEARKDFDLDGRRLRPKPRPAGRSILSAREREVVHLLIRGLSGTEIAAVLEVSPKTVDRHTTSIRTKLGTTDPTELLRLVTSGELSKKDAPPPGDGQGAPHGD